MPRILSFQPEGQWTPFELTIRAMQGRFLLRPCPAAASLIIGVLARAQELYGDRIHIYYGAGTSNHLHLLIESKSSIDRAHFKALIMANISKELGHLFRWTEHLFGRRTRDIPILDPDAFMQRIEYFAQHWRKENLVGAADEPPGIQWQKAVSEGKPLQGIWYDRTGYSKALQAWSTRRNQKSKDPGPKPTLQDFAHRKTLQLHPLPQHEGLTEAQRQASWKQILNAALSKLQPPKRPPVGPEKLATQSPHKAPAKSKRSPAPKVHTTLKECAMHWRGLYDAFVGAYRDAWARLRSALSKPDHPLAFPQGGVPPTSPNPESTAEPAAPWAPASL